MKLLLTVLLFALPLQAQTTIKNFDAVLSYDQSDVVIQPPPGKTWLLMSGSFVIDKAEEGQGVTVYTQWSDDPGLCTNLIRVQLSPTMRWIPIVDGFVSDARYSSGQVMTGMSPIKLVYPMRLVIHLAKAVNPVRTWTRFTIEETNQDSLVDQTQSAPF